MYCQAMSQNTYIHTIRPEIANTKPILSSNREGDVETTKENTIDDSMKWHRLNLILNKATS